MSERNVELGFLLPSLVENLFEVRKMNYVTYGYDYSRGSGVDLDLKLIMMYVFIVLNCVSIQLDKL